MVAIYWPSTCVFNKLYLENLLAPLRHTFPITTFHGWYLLTRIAMGPWPVARFCLAGYARGHVCNLGTTLTKYFQKDKLVSQYHYECYKMTSSNGNIFSRYWSFVRRIHLSPKDSPHRGQWRGALIYILSAHKQTPESKQSRRRCFETPSRSLWRHCKWSQNLISQYGPSATLLAKTVYGRNLLTVCARVRWVVSWKFVGSFTPHLSINNSFRVDICWPVFPWGHDQSSVSVWPAVTVVTCAI